MSTSTSVGNISIPNPSRRDITVLNSGVRFRIAAFTPDPRKPIQFYTARKVIHMSLLNSAQSVEIHLTSSRGRLNFKFF